MQDLGEMLSNAEGACWSGSTANSILSQLVCTAGSVASSYGCINGGAPQNSCSVGKIPASPAGCQTGYTPAF